jgi:hypothetical protein
MGSRSDASWSAPPSGSGLLRPLHHTRLPELLARRPASGSRQGGLDQLQVHRLGAAAPLVRLDIEAELCAFVE